VSPWAAPTRPGGRPARLVGLLLLLVGLLLVVAACSGAGSTPKPTVTPTPGPAVAAPFSPEPPSDWSGGTIAMGDLPDQAIETLKLVELGGPYPYRQDDGVFGNREGLLPSRPSGAYREYTVVTPGSPDRGARRLVIGEGRFVYYTDDHYDSFRFVTP
jgi:ribonuclease T1